MTFALHYSMSPGADDVSVVWPSGLRFNTLLGAAKAAAQAPPCFGVMVVNEDTGLDALPAHLLYVPPLTDNPPF